LSFRVSLLPYVEQENLYRQFDLKQNWDGPRNQPHSNVVIATYQNAVAENKSSASTPYRAFVGGGAMFNEDGRPVPHGDIKDGAGNTIMMASATEEVPWAAPREMTYSPTGPLPKLGPPGSDFGGTNVLLADGSVRFLRKETSESVVRALITRAGQDSAPDDW
jgi:prepilin-type processing-associated H-X9-DG protein